MSKVDVLCVCNDFALLPHRNHSIFRQQNKSSPDSCSLKKADDVVASECCFFVEAHTAGDLQVQMPTRFYNRLEFQKCLTKVRSRRLWRVGVNKAMSSKHAYTNEEAGITMIRRQMQFQRTPTCFLRQNLEFAKKSFRTVRGKMSER